MTRHQFVDAPQTWTACIATHSKDPERPRQTSKGLLCFGHHAALEQLLAELPALLDDVNDALVRYGNGLNPKVSGTKEEPLPYGTNKDGDNPPSMALRDARAVLASWCLWLIDEHPSSLHAPQDHPTAMSRFLLRHLDWCCEQDLAGELLREMREIRTSLRHAAFPSHIRRVELGNCDAHRACDLTSHAEVDPCDGQLRAKVSDGDDEMPDIECTHCAARYQPIDWRPLARRLDKHNAWLTSAQLSELLRVPLGSVWRWASEDDWRRVDGRPKRYHLDDAQASYEARRVESEAS